MKKHYFRICVFPKFISTFNSDNLISVIMSAMKCQKARLDNNLFICLISLSLKLISKYLLLFT